MGRALERASAPLIGKRITSLIMSFLFGFCGGTVCQGKVAAPILLSSLGTEAYCLQLLASEADPKPTSDSIDNDPVPTAEPTRSAASVSTCTVSEDVAPTQAPGQIDEDDGKESTLEATEMIEAVSQSEAAALQEEQQQLAKAILQSKASSGATVSGEDVVIFRLTRFSDEIRHALGTSPQLAT